MPSIQNQDPHFQLKIPASSQVPALHSRSQKTPSSLPKSMATQAETLMQARQSSQLNLSAQPALNSSASLQTSPASQPDQDLSVQPIKRLDYLGRASSLRLKTDFVRLDVQALQQRLNQHLQARPNLEHLERIVQQGQPLIAQLRSQTVLSSGQPAAGPDVTQLQQALKGLSHLDADQPLQTFEHLETAIEHANQKNRDSDLIMAIQAAGGQVQYAVIPLKASQQAAAIQTALQALPMTTAYLSDQDGFLQPLKPAIESHTAQFERVKELTDLALNDTVRGLDRNQAGNWDRHKGQAYQANLLMVHAEIRAAQGVLSDQQALAESQLRRLKEQGQDPSLAAAYREQLQTLGLQLQTLETARVIIAARLSQQPVSQHPIPGTEMLIGQDRNQPERIQARLQQHFNALESRLLVALPTEKPILEAQKNQLQQAIQQVGQRQTEAQAAELNYRLRAGALATLGQGLDQTRKNLEGHLEKLEQLESKMQSLKGTQLQEIQSETSLLRLQIDRERKDLITLLKAETQIFESHAPMKERGAQAAVALLELQISKLEGLDSQNVRGLLAAVQDTQRNLIQTVQEAGGRFAGIRPTEARALVQVSQQTDAYIQDYQKAKQQLKGLSNDAARKTTLLQNPPISAVGIQQLSAMEQSYLMKVQALIKNAAPGSALETLKNLYIALEMATDPNTAEDLRQRIDVAKIQAEIGKLSQNPEIRKAFDTARQEAIDEVFGKYDASEELMQHLLSPEFKEYLSLLPKEQQTAILQIEMSKLQFLNPARAAEVYQQWMGQTLAAESLTILAETAFQERKDAFAQVFAQVNDPLNGSAKVAKVAEEFAKALENLTPAELKQLETLMQTQGSNPQAHEKLFQFLAERLPPQSPALAELNQLRVAGKIGAFMTLVAAVAATGKIPDALAKQDFKSLADLASSAFSVAGGAKGLVEIFGISLDKVHTLNAGMAITAFSELNKMGKAVRCLEVLGPVGDLLTMGLDGYGSYQDFSKGDYIGGAAKTVSVGAAGVSAYMGTSMLLASSTGPGAPVVLIGATVLGLLAWGVDAKWGETDQETFLRQQGILKAP